MRAMLIVGAMAIIASGQMAVITIMNECGIKEIRAVAVLKVYGISAILWLWLLAIYLLEGAR